MQRGILNLCTNLVPSTPKLETNSLLYVHDVYIELSIQNPSPCVLAKFEFKLYQEIFCAFMQFFFNVYVSFAF